jgi:hypothetical protein
VLQAAAEQHKVAGKQAEVQRLTTQIARAEERQHGITAQVLHPISHMLACHGLHWFACIHTTQCSRVQGGHLPQYMH